MKGDTNYHSWADLPVKKASYKLKPQYKESNKPIKHLFNRLNNDQLTKIIREFNLEAQIKPYFHKKNDFIVKKLLEHLTIDNDGYIVVKEHNVIVKPPPEGRYKPPTEEQLKARKEKKKENSKQYRERQKRFKEEWKKSDIGKAEEKRKQEEKEKKKQEKKEEKERKKKRPVFYIKKEDIQTEEKKKKEEEKKKKEEEEKNKEIQKERLRKQRQENKDRREKEAKEKKKQEEEKEIKELEEEIDEEYNKRKKSRLKDILREKKNEYEKKYPKFMKKKPEPEKKTELEKINEDIDNLIDNNYTLQREIDDKTTEIRQLNNTDKGRKELILFKEKINKRIEKNKDKIKELEKEKEPLEIKESNEFLNKDYIRKLFKKYKIPINDYLKNNDYKHWFEKIERDYKELTDKEERLIKLNEKIENKIKELQKNNSKEGQQELKKIIDKQNDLIDLIEELKNNLNNSVKDVKELSLTFEETTDLRNELSKRNLNNLMKRGNIGKYETRPEGNELTKKLLLERFKDKLPEIKEMINDYKKREDINDYNIKELERITPQLTSKKMKTKKEENEKELEERKKEREYNKKHLKFLNVLYKRFEKLIEYTKENRFNSYKLGMYYDEKIGTYFKNFKDEFKKNDYDMRLSGFGKKLYK